MYGGRLRNAHQVEALTANLISVNRRYKAHAGIRVTDIGSNRGAAMVDEVLVERRDGVQVITINRPEAKNAINGAVAAGIAAAVDELDASDELWVGVLTGAGGTFSAGMDLKAFLRGEVPSDRGPRSRRDHRAAAPQAPDRRGRGLGRGGRVRAAAGVRPGRRAETAKLGVPEVKRALVAGAGAAMLLPRRIPQTIALEMLLTGDPITAQRAAELGLVNRVTAEGGALAGALELGATIAGNGPLAVAVTKQIARVLVRLVRRRDVGQAGRGDAAGLRVGGRHRGRDGVRGEATAGLEGSLRPDDLPALEGR